MVKRFVVPWKTGFNLSYSFATGGPYYRIAYDNAQSKYVITDAGKTINYNSMSFSVNYPPALGKKNPKVFTVWVLGVNNVLDKTRCSTITSATTKPQSTGNATVETLYFHRLFPELWRRQNTGRHQQQFIKQDF